MKVANRCFGILLLALLWLQPADAAEPEAARMANFRDRVQEQLKEANENFTFGGEPINPLALKDLLSWISDGYPGPIAAIELYGGFNSNQYYGAIQKDEKSGEVTIAADGDCEKD